MLVQPDFWSNFNDFEVHHGNEDTFREMLRLKRSVAATFTEVTLASGDLMRGGNIDSSNDPMAGLDAAAAATSDSGTGGEKRPAETTLADLEAQAAEVIDAVSGDAAVPVETNPEEIELGDDDDDDDDLEIAQVRKLSFISFRRF
eukprot:SAG31_NODE_2196_length_6219_cov_1.796569_3_plen_145_part_00